VPGSYPINFFLLNPYAIGPNQNGRMNFIDDTGQSSYNGMQVEFRQRFSNSLIWTTNYTWSKSLTNLSRDTANQNVDFTTLRDISLGIRVKKTMAAPVAGSSRLPMDRHGSTSRTTEAPGTTRARLIWDTAARSVQRPPSSRMIRSSAGSALAATGEKPRRGSRSRRRTVCGDGSMLC
jgi:hypothetical protein